MNNTTIVVVVVAVVLALLLLAVLAWAIRSRAHQRRQAEAQQIRERVDEVSQQLERREAFADETEHKARAAQAEADAKAAEAARLQQRVQADRSDLASAREELDAQCARADEIDRPVKERANEPGAPESEPRPGGPAPTDTPRVG